MDEHEPSDEYRQELFAMLWERPATEVAKELRISDVALGKLCRRLQVPKPPRGYWARVQAGKAPPRPPLPAYRAEVEARRRHEAKPNALVPLTALQREFMDHALAELASTGVDVETCELSFDGIRHVTPDLAARILIVLQTSYESWLGDLTSARTLNGALSSLGNLADKLYLHARPQVLVFHPTDRDGRRSSYGPTISIRVTQDFLARLAQLSRMAHDVGLNYVAGDLSGLDHAWSARQVYSPSAYRGEKTEFCVSATEVWVRAQVSDRWSTSPVETTRIRLRDIGAIDLVEPEERRLPPGIRHHHLKPYLERLQALQEAQAIYDSLADSFYDMDRVVPDDRLALFDRLWSGQGEEGPLIAARKAWREIEAELDRWDRELESERLSLCQDVLGISVGDIVLVQSAGKPLRVAVEGMSVYLLNEDIAFNISGRRFRKDGLPGKRTENFYIAVESDAKS